MRRGTGVASTAAVVAVLATGCSASGTDGAVDAGGKDRVAATSPPPRAGSPEQGQGERTAAPESPTGPKKPGPSPHGGDGKGQHKTEPLEYGSEGPEVTALQRKLRRLHYDPGAVDGVFGATTRYALWAFQKINDLGVDGVVGPKTREALEDPRTPKPLRPGGPPERVGIDLARQLLYVYDGGELALISHISSGSQQSYCTEDGQCGDAVTPTGNFSAIWRVNGWRKSGLGRLYNPVYFAAGGFAVHGSPSVPQYPASHGCVRIPMHTAEKFPDLVGEGEAFYVRG